jgi:hypothetical protein
MILKIFSPKNVAKKLAFFAQSTACFCKKFITKLVFEKNANFSPKIGKNCDHNIDPSLENWSQSYDFGIYNYNDSVV